MAKVDYLRTDFTGGGANDLDGTDGATLNDGDRGNVITATYGDYHYVLDASIGGASNSPWLIPPAVNPGSKRWVLLSVEGGRSGLVNLLGGASALSVYSDSDTNKGLSRGAPVENVAVDNGTHEPVVGELITGDDTGAVGKVISFTDTGGNWAGVTGTGTLCMGACTGRFNNDETCTGDHGSAAGFDINMPDTAAGVDLMRNTDHWVGAAAAVPPNGWAVTIAGLFTIFDSGDGAPYDKCLKVEVNAVPTANPQTGTSFTTVVGTLYKLGFYFKHGTATEGRVLLGTSVGGAEYKLFDSLTDAAWTQYTYTFEATTTTAHVGLLTLSGVAGQFELFDEIACYETSPCCTEANALAMDGWVKNATLDLYREHHGVNVPKGVFYSCLSVPSAQNDYCYFGPGFYANEEFYEPFAGDTITIAIYAKSDTADDLVISIFDGTTETQSSAHTGGGDFEWLEVPAIIGAAPSQLRLWWQHTSATPGNAYIGAWMWIKGSSIGEGNFLQMPGEVVQLKKDIIPTGYDMGAGDIAADVDAVFNVEALTEGRIPKGIAGIYVNIRVRDSAAATDLGVWMGPDTTYCAQDIGDVGVELDGGIGNDEPRQGGGWVRCNPDGDPWLFINQSGAGQLDAEIRISRVRLR